MDGFIGNVRKCKFRRFRQFSLMITSIHTLIYSDDAPATRAFLRDVLGMALRRGCAGRRRGLLILLYEPKHPLAYGL